MDKRNADRLLAGVGPWDPQVLAEVNDYDLKVADFAGEFARHTHEDTDEVFVVLRGRLHLDLPDGTVTLEEHDAYTVPRGVPHRPRSEEGARVLMVEPRGTTQDGTADGLQGRR